MVCINIFYSLQVSAHVHTSIPNLNMLVASCIWGPWHWPFRSLTPYTWNLMSCQAQFGASVYAWVLHWRPGFLCFLPPANLGQGTPNAQAKAWRSVRQQWSGLQPRLPKSHRPLLRLHTEAISHEALTNTSQSKGAGFWRTSLLTVFLLRSICVWKVPRYHWWSVIHHIHPCLFWTGPSHVTGPSHACFELASGSEFNNYWLVEQFSEHFCILSHAVLEY